MARVQAIMGAGAVPMTSIAAIRKPPHCAP
jgi:hypothetical protein